MDERKISAEEWVLRSGSREIETAWRITSHPGKYSDAEYNNAVAFLNEELKNWVTNIQKATTVNEIDLSVKMFLGVYHHEGFELPLEYRFKFSDNN